jgi:hypothetical protein
MRAYEARRRRTLATDPSLKADLELIAQEWLALAEEVEWLERNYGPAPRGFHRSALSIAQIDDFVSDSNGLRLIGAFMRIDNADLRRKIVMLVQEIAGDDGN